MTVFQSRVPHCPDCGMPAGSVHTPECPVTGALHRMVEGEQVIETPHRESCTCTWDFSTEPPTLADYDCGREIGAEVATLPTPGEVIKSPHSDLSIEKVAPEHREMLLSEIGNPARAVGIRLPDPFTGVELPPETDYVNHPPHYRAMPGVPFQCIDVTRRLTFTVGNAVKYIWRADAKNGRQDIEKARWYLADAIEHADPVYLPERLEETAERLHVVARAQADPNRVLFYNAVRLSMLPNALEGVNRMLGHD